MSINAEPDPNQQTRPRYSRFFFDLTTDIPIDPATGLLQGNHWVKAAGGLGLVDLIEERFTLVIGPPYTGKSTILRQLVGPSPTQREVLFSDVRSQNELKPEGWTRWVEEGGRRLWCIDSLDENSKAPHSILLLLKALSAARKSELNLLVSCRENEVPASFATEIAQALEVRCRTVRIAPPDRAEAETICGREALERVIATIRDRDLQEMAGQPAALEWLARSASQLESATKGILWKGIIEAILEPKAVHAGERALQYTLDERFRAASRLAFFLEFGDFRSVRVSGTDALTVNPSLESLFPARDASSHRLRGAAHEVVRSGLVRPFADGIRIHHRHVREWLVAHELSRLEAVQIEELLGDGKGELDLQRARIGEALLELDAPHLAQAWLEAAFSRFRRSLEGTVAEFLNRLLTQADAAPHGLSAYHPIQQLRALNRDAVSTALRESATNWEVLTDRRRVLLLQIAEGLDSSVLVSKAQESLVNTLCEENLGEQAVEYLTRFKSLPDLVALAKRLSPAETPRFLARVLLTALDLGLMSSLDVLRFEVKSRLGLSDIRTSLELAVADKLTLDEALTCLEMSESMHVPDEVLERAAQLLSRAPTIAAAPRIAAGIRKSELENRYQDRARWLEIVAKNGPIRQSIYKAEILEGGSTDLSEVAHTLNADDLDWLVQSLPASGTSGGIWDAFRLASHGGRADVMEKLRARFPDEIRRIEEGQAEFEKRALAQRREWSKDQPERFKLAEVIRGDLDSDLDPLVLIHRLGWAVFGKWGPNNVDGKVEDLSLELREEVLVAARDALRDAEPTPILPGNSISGNVLSEANVAEVVIERFGALSLGAKVVRKWLPALLRALEKDEAILVCSEAFPDEAVTVFAWFIARDVNEKDGHAWTASRVPSRLWTQGLLKRALAILNDVSLPPNGRADLMMALLDVAPSSALEVALRWAHLPLDPAMTVVTTRVLLTLCVPDGLLLLRKDVALRGIQAILDQGPTFDSWGRGTQLQNWTDGQLVELVHLLSEWFPQETYELPGVGEAWIVTNEHRLIEARDSAIRVLLGRPTSSARDALDILAPKAPRLARQLKQRDVENQTTKLAVDLALASGSPPAVPPDEPPGDKPFRYPEPRRISLHHLLRLLSSGEYRLARTSADLARVLVETFEKINEGIPEDISLLFRDDKEGNEKHVTEPVLQAYLSRRLEDLMPGRIVDREAWQRHDKRVDFLVRVKPNESTVVAVPIELKWSDHPEVKTAARDQLGALYMGPAERDNGLLVIAWVAKAGTEAKLKALKESIAQNVREFETASPGKHILVSWLEVRPPAKKKKSS